MSSVIPEKTIYPWEKFCDACDELDGKYMETQQILQQMDYIWTTIAKDVKEKYSMQEAISFTGWLKNNKDQIKNCETNSNALEIKVENSTEEFVLELVDQYSKLNFEFPFYVFSFGVSTGEYSFLSMFANIYDVAQRRQKSANSHESGEKGNLLLILDEADATFHPKWQREYMLLLVRFCKQVLKNLNIKIIITTHSPIMLSDFPDNSVLYIKKENGHTVMQTMCQRKTFGSDIHSLFLDSFFLNESGVIGAFAEEKINEVVDKLLDKEVKTDNERKQINNIIDYIGEGIIRDKLKLLISPTDGIEPTKVSDKGKKIIEDTVQELKAQKAQLEQMIYYLEDSIND